MPDFHRLDPAADAPFLRRAAADPLSRVAFRPTNAVAMCATCGLVSLRETWEACGGCPNGHAMAAPWDAEAAARASGDGAARPVAAPVARPAVAPLAPPIGSDPVYAPPAYAGPEPKRRTGLWIALGAAAALVVALGIAALLNRDDTPARPDTPVATDGPTAPQAVAAEAGETAGELDDSDFRTTDGRYQDLYAFAADSSGRTLSFTVSSDTFYPDVVVTGPDGTATDGETVSADDDEETDTRTVAVGGLRGPGVYQILVSSRRPQTTGGYTLRIRQEDPVVALPVNGRQVAGELKRTSVKADGRYRDTYSFTGAPEREHTITVMSSAFTPTVTVTGPSGAAVRGGTSAPTSGGTVYTFTPTTAGSYRVAVSTRETDRTGAYTILLAVAAPPPPAPTAGEEDAGVTLRAGGAPVRDSLAAGDSRTYSASGRVGDRVSVEVRATGFTPTLTIIGPDGQRTPATPDGDRARAQLTLPADGRFRVVVGSSGGSGAYSVSLEQRAGVTATPIPRTPGADVPRPAPAPDPADVKEPLPDPNYRPQPLGGTN